MFGKRSKIRTNLELKKPGNQILRLLRLDKTFAVPHAGPEVEEQEESFEGPWKEMRNAQLEAETNRAQALQILEQSKRLY